MAVVGGLCFWIWVGDGVGIAGDFGLVRVIGLFFAAVRRAAPRCVGLLLGF